MTRLEAINAIMQIVNSGIIDNELKETLTEVCNHLRHNDFELSEVDISLL